MNGYSTLKRRHSIGITGVTLRKSSLSRDRDLRHSVSYMTDRNGIDPDDGICVHHDRSNLPSVLLTDKEQKRNSSRFSCYNRQSVWRIEDQDVPELPEIYPYLASPLIFTDCKVAQIGDHVLTFLKVNSICSVYDSERARVVCFADRASFVVQFWRRKSKAPPRGPPMSAATDAKTERENFQYKNVAIEEEDEVIILEVQRRNGCSYSMHNIRKALKKTFLPMLQKSRIQPIPYKSCSWNQPIIRIERIFLKPELRPFRRPSMDEEKLGIHFRRHDQQHNLSPETHHTDQRLSLPTTKLSTTFRYEKVDGHTSTDSLIGKVLTIPLVCHDSSLTCNAQKEEISR